MHRQSLSLKTQHVNLEDGDKNDRIWTVQQYVLNAQTVKVLITPKGTQIDGSKKTVDPALIIERVEINIFDSQTPISMG